jgi:hypothetical protein
MPISRRRKKVKGAMRSAVALPREEVPKTWNVKLNGAKIILLKNDPDFLTMMKIGRAINAVSFALTEVVNYENDKSVVGRRQYQRSYLVLAGYLHQAVTVLLSIKGRYLLEPSFEELRHLVLDFEYKEARDYIRKIRNFAAFHLDEFDELTRKTLSTLRPTTYKLLSVDEDAIVPYYFELADTLDLNFLISKLSRDGEQDKTQVEIVQKILDYAYELLNACNGFQLAIGDKINIHEHTY